MAIRSIQAATDFSPRAQRAVERAALLAQENQATLYLLHVLPVISWKMFGKILFEHPLVTEKQLYDAAMTRLHEVAEDCRKRHGIRVESHVDIGKPHECIRDHARKHAVNLTVLGPHAGNFGRDLFIGSTAIRMLHGAIEPALIAETPPQAPYHTVLVAVDFSDISYAAIDAAAVVAPKAATFALHVYDVEFEGKMRYASVEQSVIQKYHDAAESEALRLMGEFLSTAGQRSPILPMVRNGYPSRVILDEARNLHADLIVMGKHGQAGLEEFFFGSVTEGVLYGLDRDLLVVTEQRA
ncbi:MAG: universal stress protein [Pseudomonadota bacterium]